MSVVVAADAPLGGQAAQPVEPLVAERVVGPLGGGPERLGDAVRSSTGTRRA